MYSWVHITDTCRAIEWIFDHKEMEGVYNCCSPKPVSNTVFMKMLRKITGHKFGLPAYEWMLKIGAAIIGTETELILKSRWVLPAKLLQSGFRFKYEDNEDAFTQIVNETPRKNYHLF
jgi:NAD dependent epimerase/dehydratase family enzyme